MTSIGIICEYNPFHNGHLYHINKIKEKYPNSIIVLVLNGLFLERGEFSIITKENKTRLALLHGVDIVVELPIIYGTQSADIFADAAVTILNNFKVDKIIIGSEENNIDILKNIAKTELYDNTYNTRVKEYLSMGYNYPTSLAKSLNINFSFKPNDLLGISYLKSILLHNYNIELETIKRTSDYHDTKSNNNIISAKNIREKLLNNEDITPYLPDKSFIQTINTLKYFDILKYKINMEDISNILDMDEGIEYRLKKYINSSKSLDEFISKIKTKRYTYNKINRLLIHILLNIPKDINNTKITSTKVLGFNLKGKGYLKSIKKDLIYPTKSDKNSLIYQKELQASIIYDLINNTNTYEFELKDKPIII